MNPVVGVNGDATTLTQRMTTENEEPRHIDGVVELILTIVTIHIYIITVPLPMTVRRRACSSARSITTNHGKF